jgi:hypothetical protein
LTSGIAKVSGFGPPEMLRCKKEGVAPPPTPAREAPGNQSWKSNFLAINKPRKP